MNDWIDKHPWMTFFLGFGALSALATIAMPKKATGLLGSPGAPPTGYTVQGAYATNAAGQTLYWTGSAWSLVAPAVPVA